MAPLMSVLALTLLASSAEAQDRITGPTLITDPPTLIAQGAETPIAIESVDVQARIVGHLVETSMTMVFHNPNRRVLAGDLTFPLPAGATVSGYGLDVNGRLVDGVVVDKVKARQVFETEVRKGVDPGLVEKVAGAAFRTRVFPLPANGRRTVRVSWVSEVDVGADGARYRMPLAFPEPLDATIKIEVVRGEAAFEGTTGIPGLQFQTWEDRVVAETTGKGVRLNQPLVVALPDLNRRPVAVERGPDGRVYFAAHVDVPAPAAVQRIEPKRVGLMWDASASRREAAHAREVAVLQRWLDSLTGPVAVELLPFAHDALSSTTFRLPAQRAELIAAVEDIDYDGGTWLGALAAAATKAPDLYVLFSDGVGNLGDPELPTLDAPLFALNGAAVANHDALRALALRSGGAWIDLTSTPEAAAAAAIGRSPFAFRGAEATGASQGFPRIAEPVDGAFAYAGVLDGASGEVTLRFAGPGAADVVRTLRIDAANAPEGTLLQRFWAGKQVADLAVGGKANEPAMAELGKRYGIVTPGTSLLVLETLEQYVEHDVRPPASLPSMRAEFARQTQAKAKAVAAEDQRKLERIVSLWEERVAWWEREFDWTPPPEQKPSKSEGGAFGRGAMRRESAADVMMEAPAEAAAELMDDMEMDEAEPAARPAPAPAKAKKKGGKDAGGPSIALRAWDPDTPYLAELKAAAAGQQLAVYRAQRTEWGGAPAFYLDAADFFSRADADVARRILSNLVELDLESPALMRVFAQRAIQLDDLDVAIAVLERVRELRPDEPQSHRDLGLALAARAERRAAKPGLVDDALADYQAALDALGKVVMDEWPRFDEIELIALVELNDVLVRAQQLGDVRFPVDPRLVRHLDMDVRIVMTWDADMTDMDLHVLEPSGEEAYYSHNRTRIGGRVSRDFTQGYGPEEYTIRRAMPGTYTVKTKFFGSSAATLQGAVTLTVDLYTDYGRPTQQHQVLTLRLTEAKETFTVGELAFAGATKKAMQVTK
jgi:Ca-activated chloride channel family protein